jgi:hypothetical protein
MLLNAILNRCVNNNFCHFARDGFELSATSDTSLSPNSSAPNYCGEFDNAGAMMSVDETLMCSFQILKVRSCMCVCVFVCVYLYGSVFVCVCVCMCYSESHAFPSIPGIVTPISLCFKLLYTPI